MEYEETFLLESSEGVFEECNVKFHSNTLNVEIRGTSFPFVLTPFTTVEGDDFALKTSTEMYSVDISSNGESITLHSKTRKVAEECVHALQKCVSDIVVNAFRPAFAQGASGRPVTYSGSVSGFLLRMTSGVPSGDLIFAMFSDGSLKIFVGDDVTQPPQKKIQIDQHTLVEYLAGSRHCFVVGELEVFCASDRDSVEAWMSALLESISIASSVANMEIDAREETKAKTVQTHDEATRLKDKERHREMRVRDEREGNDVFGMPSSCSSSLPAMSDGFVLRPRKDHVVREIRNSIRKSIIQKGVGSVVPSVDAHAPVQRSTPFTLDFEGGSSEDALSRRKSRHVRLKDLPVSGMGASPSHSPDRKSIAMREIAAVDDVDHDYVHDVADVDTDAGSVDCVSRLRHDLKQRDLKIERLDAELTMLRKELLHIQLDNKRKEAEIRELQESPSWAETEVDYIRQVESLKSVVSDLRDQVRELTSLKERLDLENRRLRERSRPPPPPPPPISSESSSSTLFRSSPSLAGSIYSMHSLTGSVTKPTRVAPSPPPPPPPHRPSPHGHTRSIPYLPLRETSTDRSILTGSPISNEPIRRDDGIPVPARASPRLLRPVTPVDIVLKPSMVKTRSRAKSKFLIQRMEQDQEG
eukprot:TRINITY_DN808_c0_g1_i1.p1 TRINITY_DN808_c0_g1~~TRINITY_DN808_c0_g1_i1.p1  ORF type:complete len:641 (+),score=184.06 TRINITY_DN808_c0_g1_i1:132-2054(+)